MKHHTTFVGRLAGQSSFIVHSGMMYSIGERYTGSDHFLSVGSQRYDLTPFLPIATLETLEERLTVEERFSFASQYVQEALQAEIFSEQKQKSTKNRQKTHEFVLLEVLPQMIDTAYELGELLGVDLQVKKTGREVIEQVLQLHTGAEGEGKDIFYEKNRLREKVLQQLEQKRRKNPAIAVEGVTQVKNPQTIWDQVVAGPVYVIGEQVYLLEETKKKIGEEREHKEDIQFQIQGKEYTYRQVCTTESLERSYQELVLNLLRQKALSEWNVQTDVNVNIPPSEKTRRTALEKLADEASFSYGNLGYKREGDVFYVYWEIPKFAMQNPLRKAEYHPFSAAKICVKVNASDGQIYHEGAYIAERMAHPFLRSWDTSYEHICILSGGNFANTGEGIVRHISTAINAFTNGLTMESLDIHGVRDDAALYFGRSLKTTYTQVGTLTRDEAVKQGYRITNEWILEASDMMKGGEKNGN